MTLELVNELGEILSKEVKDRPLIERVKPLTTGERAPIINLTSLAEHWATADRLAQATNVLTLPQLTRRGPVVVGFYCPCWGRYAGPFLNSLIQLASQVERAGGQLLIFTNEQPKYLSVQARQAPMMLVYDADKSVARQFGVYSEADPIWDRVSGISEEVYIPALYVVDHNCRIQYHFFDENFEGFTDQTTLNATLFQ